MSPPPTLHKLKVIKLTLRDQSSVIINTLISARELLCRHIELVSPLREQALRLSKRSVDHAINYSTKQTTRPVTSAQVIYKICSFLFAALRLSELGDVSGRSNREGVVVLQLWEGGELVGVWAENLLTAALGWLLSRVPPAQSWSYNMHRHTKTLHV